MFYSNEHEPIHVHGQCQGRESKAEIIVENGKVVQLEQITMLCSVSLSSLRSAGFQPAWRPGWPPSQAGSPPHPLPGRLVPALVFPDARGLARLQPIVKRASVLLSEGEEAAEQSGVEELPDRDRAVCGGDSAEMGRLFRSSQADRSADDYSEDQMKLSEDTVIDIVRVERLSGYRLRLSFSDGAERVIDFEPFLRAPHATP